MGNRAVLQTCAAFLCGVMFGLYVYTYSSQDGISQVQKVVSYKSEALPNSYQGNTLPSSYSNATLHVDHTPSKTRRRPLHNGNPSIPDTQDNSDRTDNEHSKKITDSKDITPKPQYILILAYMRSGSTLTGDVIQQDRSTVYSFEPLFNIWQTNTSTFANGNKKVYSNIADRKEESLRQLKAWFTCSLLDVDLETLHYIFMDFGLKTRAVKPCMKKYAKKYFNKIAKEKCVDPLIRRCESSSVRVVKTIRTSASDIEPLLNDLPTLKVIHLVRDPRGILVSRQRVDFRRTIGHPLTNVSKGLCDRIMKDYYTFQYINKVYPDRVMTLRYEELATHPLETVKRIYEFVGLHATERVLNAVDVMTSSKKNIERDYNTARKNSVFTANAWRLKLLMNATSLIDNACGPVYEKYGYMKVESRQQLKNLKGEPLWIEKINT